MASRGLGIPGHARASEAVAGSKDTFGVRTPEIGVDSANPRAIIA